MQLGRRTTDLLELLFGDTRPVRRREYVATGALLLALKYAGQAWIVQHVTGRWLSPKEFLDPLWPLAGPTLWNLPSQAAWATLCWSVPFLWIAVAMSVRRAACAGFAPANGLFVLAPLLKIPAIVVLCTAPDDVAAELSRPRPAELELAGDRRGRAGGPPPPSSGAILRASLLGWLAGGLALVSGVWLARSYGVALFVLTPVVAGFVVGFSLNRAGSIGRARTAGSAALIAVIGLTALLAGGAEGGVCLLMAAPLVLGLAAIGGLVGHSAAQCGGRSRDTGIALALLPVIAGLEASLPSASPLIEVRSEILIHATPEQIWPHVIAFPELPPSDDWLFRVSIADPRRATIEGEGVGALRRCEFSTGPFIEPITAWDPPRRLAFDVAEQPPPMRELSPWGQIDVPHLDGYLRSRRGEFLLEPVDATTTRLVGTTWYELDVLPRAYWRAWSDSFIHAIHGKVLRHIAAQVESG
jgi:hypothetical protein